MVHGSKRRLPLKLSASSPWPRRWVLTRRSRVTAAGSYRRFQKTAVAPDSAARVRKVSNAGPRRMMSFEPRFPSAELRVESDCASHHFEAAPGGHSPSASGEQM